MAKTLRSFGHSECYRVNIRRFFETLVFEKLRVDCSLNESPDMQADLSLYMVGQMHHKFSHLGL